MFKLHYYCSYFTCKVMLKLHQARLYQYMNQELPDVHAGFRKGRGTRDQMPTFFESWRKQRSSRKTSTSTSLTMLKPLTVWITANWKILKEVGIPDHLTCLMRNLYAGQEATVRTLHGTTDWFQIRKGVLNNPFSTPNDNVSIFWPHRVLGTGTCAQQY